MNTHLSNKDKLNLISDLATMLTAGIPILEAVESLLEDAKGNQRKILLNLKKDLEQGQKISDSFAKFPHAFDPVSINLIRASEQSSTLDTTLKDLVANIKKDIEFNDKVKGALAYPVLVMGVFLLVLIMILVFVIPRIGRVFSQMSIPLPLPTKILIATSNLVINYSPFLIALIITLIVGMIFLYKKKRKEFLNFIFPLPLISRLIREIDLTRFTRSMALLLSSGLPLTEALDLSSNVVVKKEIHKIINQALENISSGKNLAESFKHSHRIIPSIMIRITQAGEKTGTLDKSMQELSEYFDYQVSNTLKLLTILLEPIMLVVIGIMIGGVMLSIVAPIYGLIGQIAPQ